MKPITRKGQENLKATMDALEESGSLRPTEHCGKTQNIPE